MAKIYLREGRCIWVLASTWMTMKSTKMVWTRNIAFFTNLFPGLADEYPVIGACVEGANRRRGRVIKGWADRLGEALTKG